MINNLYIKATPAAASITWGSITGTLSSQTDLQNALDAKFDDPTGTVSQYVRGDGSLANFPSSTGGGSSLAFYLNGSVAQGTIGGVAFKEMDRVPVLGAGTDFTIATNGYIQSFITDANVPNLLEIPAGNWNFETYFSSSSAGGSPSFYVELYKWNGATLSLIASNSATPEGITNGTTIDLYVSALAVPQTALTVTDRLAVRIYVNNSGRTIKLHTENSHLCEVITTFSTGLTALNGLTAQVQNFATGTTGTDFGISSATSTHTFNLPTASAANRGALSSADWTTFNNKQAALVSGTNIKTVNGTTILGSGDLVVGGTQVGYRGFKYNMGIGEDFPSPPVPLAGQAFYLLDGDGYYQGFRISQRDANGKSTNAYLNKLNDQPITIVNSDASINIIEPGAVTYVTGANPYYDIAPYNFSGTAVSGVGYIDFNTSNPTLVSGTTIKTINGSSVLGSGNLVVSGGVTSVTGTAPVVSSGGATPAISMAAATTSVNGYLTSTDWTTFNNKQAALVSGTNIKTVNSTTILGSGDLAVQATLVSGTNIKTINSTSLLGSGNVAVQPTLVSGTNIVTINGSSLLASGNLVVGLPAWVETNATDLTIWNNGQGNIASNTSFGDGALKSNTSTFGASTAIGYRSVFSNTSGSGNTALGYFSLFTNTSGGGNVAIGREALYFNNTTSNNVAVGTYALNNNIAQGITAVGNAALRFNTTGTANTAFGNQALQGNTTGLNNTAVGNQSLITNTIGAKNTSVGQAALSLSTTADDNTALGYYAGFANTTGAANVFIGSSSGSTHTTGASNIVIGTDANTGNFSSSIIIGRSATATANNQFVVGSSTYTAGTVTTETLAMTKTWSVIINGVAQKILLA